MNYFSHYLLLSEPKNSYKIVGCILPDLVRDKKLQPSFYLNNDLSTANVHFSSIHLGIENHFLVDASFHNSAFFKTYTKLLSKSIRVSKKIALEKYTYFIAHILLELYIDHLLIAENEKEVTHFYSQLQSADEDILAGYFEDFLPHNDYDLFSMKKNKFVQRKFLYDYKNTDQLGDLISYVLQKVGIKPLSTQEKKELVNIIENNYRRLIVDELPGLFEQMKNSI